MKQCEAQRKRRDAKRVSKGMNLLLRNGIFYFIVELPRVDGRRRYLRQSLKTTNYYEARERAEEMKKMHDPNYFINEFERLLNNLDFVGCYNTSSNIYVGNRFETPKILSKKNKYDDVSQLVMFRGLIANQKETNSKVAKLLERFEKILPAIEDFMKNGSLPAPVAKSITPRTISEVLEAWIFKDQNCAKEQSRKRAAIARLASEVGLTLDNDYSEFHNVDITDQIFKNIIARADIQNDFKRKNMGYIKNFAEFASRKYPEDYKLNVVSDIPKIKATKESDKNPPKPYSDDQLLNMFNPAHDFFKDNSDMFFTCLIGLFTGARINAAATLQYKDIKTVDGIECIEFKDDCPGVKTLKTDASERIIPIHNQLLNVGFVDYVRRKKQQTGASDTDFIFPRCITTGGVYYEKYPRILFNFLAKIGIKTKNGNKLGFHSFRNNASVAMQDAGISETYIYKIIGWKGKGIMAQSYSKRELAKIKAEMDRFGYDFLAAHFAEWKKVMSEKS